jgi:hypothetical protein
MLECVEYHQGKLLTLQLCFKKFSSRLEFNWQLWAEGTGVRSGEFGDESKKRAVAIVQFFHDDKDPWWGLIFFSDIVELMAIYQIKRRNFFKKPSFDTNNDADKNRAPHGLGLDRVDGRPDPNPWVDPKPETHAEP